MRVIAGTARGRKLGRVPRGVRPVSDRAREGIFSSLGEEVAEATVLDLYSGTGAMAIEALSRGAREAMLVDRSREAVETARANLELTGLATMGWVVAAEVLGFLRRNNRTGSTYDLVFIDPPYELGPPELDEVLAELDSRWLATDAWTVVLTRGPKSSTPVIPLNWSTSRTLSYGDSSANLFRPHRRPRTG